MKRKNIKIDKIDKVDKHTVNGSGKNNNGGGEGGEILKAKEDKHTVAADPSLSGLGQKGF